MTIPIWLVGLAANGALLVGSFWIARYRLRQPRGLASVLSTAVVFWAATTVSLEILSVFGAINSGSLLLLSVLVLAAGFAVRQYCRPIEQDSTGEKSENADEPFSVTESFSWDALAGLALVLVAALVLGIRSLLLAVKVVSDGPIYHLYFAARWWKAGRLLMVAAPFGENAATYFPANGDLWFTWLITSWGGDRLARVGQAPFLVLASVAPFACARLIGAGRSASLVATCWFASSTPFLLFSFEPNVDTIFVAGYLLGAYFLLRAACVPSDRWAILLASLAAGLALGTKAVGVVFIPPLLAIAIVAVLAQKLPVRTKIARALTVVTVPLVTGGYWYIRNALLTGNPVYPLEVRLLGRTIWLGWYGREAMQFSPYYVPVEDWRALIDTSAAVLDPRLVPLWLAAIGISWVLVQSKIDASRRWTSVFSLMAILNVALYWLCIPYRTQQRFMLQALGLAVVPLAVLFDRWRWLRQVGVLLLALHLLTPENWPFPNRDDAIPWDLSERVPNAVGSLIPFFPRIQRAFYAALPARSALSLVLLCVMILLANLTVGAWSCVSRNGRTSWRCAVVAIVISAAFVWIGDRDLWSDAQNARIEVYPPFPNFYAGWQHLERDAGPDGARVAYAGTNIPYYLLGKRLRNEVRYINIDRHRNWLLHDYHHNAHMRGEGTWPNPRPGWDRAEPDYEAWVENLEAEGIQFLVVTRVNPAEGAHNVADSSGFPIERVWADLHPDRFEPLYGRSQNDPWIRLYRFRPGKPRNG
jgi:hypothetical protein